MPTKKQRYTITVEDELFKLIEDFRFEGRYETKSDATSALLKIGLEQYLKDREKHKEKK